MPDEMRASEPERVRRGPRVAETPIEQEEAEPPFLLALDIGTSSVRAALFDARGFEVTGTHVRLLRSFCTTAEGGAELDAEESIVAVVRLVDEVLAGAAARELRIEAVAIACFWHSLVGADAQGRAVTPVYGWADTRAGEQALALRRRIDEAATHARTGCRFHPSYWPAKLLWLEQQRRELWRGAARWLSFAELLLRRLCGRALASVSMASGTGLFDQHACTWDAPLVAELSLREAQLPAVAREHEPLTLAPEFAARWPALAGRPIFPGIADGAANNIGEGCTSPAQAALMVGTSGAMRIVYEGQAPRRLDAALWSYRVDARRVCVGGALSDGGWLYGWMRDSLALFEPGATGAAEIPFDIEEALAACGADAHGLTVLPFWAGERSTGWNPYARGALLGLTMHTRPIEILRAGVEAVAHRFALITAALVAQTGEAFEVRASGGALTASRVWAQIIADATGRPLRLSRVREASSRGAVLLALEALGKIKSVADAQAAPAGESLLPDPARHEIYLRARERQRKLYDLLVDNQEIARLLAFAGAETKEA